MSDKNSRAVLPIEAQFLLIHEWEGGKLKPKLLNREDNIVGLEEMRELRGGKVMINAKLLPDGENGFLPFKVTAYDRSQRMILTEEMMPPGLYKVSIQAVRDDVGRSIWDQGEAKWDYETMKDISDRKWALRMVDVGNIKVWVRFVAVETPKGKIGTVEFPDGSLLGVDGHPIKTGNILTGAREGERYRGRQISMAKRWQDRGGRRPIGLFSLDGRVGVEIAETLKLADAVYTAKNEREFPLFSQEPDVLWVKKMSPTDFSIGMHK